MKRILQCLVYRTDFLRNVSFSNCYNSYLAHPDQNPDIPDTKAILAHILESIDPPIMA
jgi:hypothetical protein